MPQPNSTLTCPSCGGPSTTGLAHADWRDCAATFARPSRPRVRPTRTFTSYLQYEGAAWLA